jgi:hypothetical protein
MTQNSGGATFITPGSVTGPGSLNLGAGTGILGIVADSADFDGTVNGASGSGATAFTELLSPPATGPYLVNGFCFAACSPSGPTVPPFIPGGTIIYTNNANGVQGNDFGNGGPQGSTGTTGTGGGLGDVSPASGDTSGTQTDVLVADLSGPANSKPAPQAQPKVQGFYVSLLGNLLYEWRPLGNQLQGPVTPEQNTDYSNWGDEARW